MAYVCNCFREELIKLNKWVKKMTLSEHLKSHGFKSVKEFLNLVDSDMSHQTLGNWYKERRRIFDLLVTGVKTENFLKKSIDSNK